MITVTMFGCKKEMFDFNAESAIKNMDDLKKAITKPQVIGGGGYHVIEFYGYKDYDLDSAVSSDTVCEFALSEIGFNGSLYDGIMANSVEDEDETKRINARYTGIYTHSITLSAEMQRVITEEANRVQAELAELIAAEQAKKAAEKAKAEAEKAALLNGVEWEITERQIHDEGGKTIKYIHTITVDGETFKITERNVFDFGRCINSDGGGLYTKAGGKWKLETLDDKEGWIPHEISEAHQIAVEIVQRYGGFSDAGIRM